MPYEVFIKEQDTKKIIKKEIQTLKELKELLMLYEDKLIDFEMKENKRRIK